MGESWPELRWDDWKDTADTLHMGTQIVGKTRLALTPLQNHWWNVPLYVSARGLTTSPMPWRGDVLEIEFDFRKHLLELRMGSGARAQLELRPRTVADFYAEYRKALAGLGVEAKIWPMPVEVATPVRFDLDTEHKSYDPAAVERFHQALMRVDTLLKRFATGFQGKISPVHFFWGSFDLAVSRFSGRRAPERPGADAMTREAYSHEVSSVGFWPGNAGVSDAAFYSYIVPAPEGFSEAKVSPNAASYNTQLGEFLLPYEEVRKAESPSDALLDFCRSTYEAGATLGNWDRDALERPRSEPASAKEK
jgi:hypothetical protein